MDLWWSILSFNDHGLLLEGLNPVLLSVYLQHFCCMYQWHVASLSGTRDIGYVGRGWVYFILPTLASLGCNYGFVMVFLFLSFNYHGLLLWGIEPYFLSVYYIISDVCINHIKCDYLVPESSSTSVGVWCISHYSLMSHWDVSIPDFTTFELRRPSGCMCVGNAD